MTLEHLGIAVADADSAVALFERLLGAAPYQRETVEREGVRTVFFGDDGRAGAAPKLELLEALTPESPVAKYLEKRGPGLHHVAFEVADVEAEMARLRGLGFQLLADTPRPGADGKRIVFLHPKSTAGVLVELCETVVPPPERLDVPFEGGTLAAFVSGPEAAPPLVVLHGALDPAGRDAGATAPLVRRWARRFRVYALDFMAPGASDAFEGAALTVDGFVGNLLALLDFLGVAKTDIFGCALGGGVALHAAVRYPERFARLAVHAAHVRWTPEEEASRADLAPGGARRARLFERMRALEADLLPDEASLAALPHPTLVSAGDADPFLRPALHLHATLPGSSLAVFPGMAHPFSALPTDDLDRLADLVGRFLHAESAAWPAARRPP